MLGLSLDDLYKVAREMVGAQEVEVTGSDEQEGGLDIIDAILIAGGEQELAKRLIDWAKRRNDPAYIIVNNEQELLKKLQQGYELIRELSGNRYLLKFGG